MLSAKKIYLFEKLFGLYNKNLIKRYFNSLRVCGLSEISKREPEIPMIIYLNHSNWWDGLVAFELSRKLKLDSFFLMEDKHLRKLLAFRRLGAFSVVRENPRDAVKSINYAVDILNNTEGRALWIFPQGEILPNDMRPLIFYNGISRIIQKLGTSQVVSIALRIEFLNSYKPDIFVNIGAPRCCSPDKYFDSKKTTQDLAISLTEDLDELKQIVADGKFDNFENLI